MNKNLFGKNKKKENDSDKMFNNKTKTFILLIILFVTVIGLSATTATTVDTDTADNTNTITDTNTINTQNSIEENSKSNDVQIIKKTSENVKTATEGTFTELNTQITNNNEITLDKNYTKTEEENNITIDKTISIDGKGNTITSSNGMFTLTSKANATFKNVNFKGGDGGNSAFVISGTLYLINCTFTNHNSNSTAFSVDSGEVYVKNSVFSNIQSRGAFYMSARVNGFFNDSEFINCSNTVYGGAITKYGRGQLGVNNCIFKDNTAALRGGAIYSAGTLNLQNSLFTGNTVNSTTINNGQGGKCVYTSGNILLENNTMNDNHGITADIFNAGSTIYTPVTIEIGNSTCVEGEKVNLTAKIYDDMGNTIDLYSKSTAVVGLDDSQDLTFFNFTIENEKYSVLREESVINVTKTITPTLPVGIYTINAEYWDEEFDEATVIPGTLNITETPLYSYTKLQNEIGETTDSTITLECDVKRGETETTVNINKDITIDLNSYTWDANGEQALIIENDATLTLKNGAIVNVGNQNPSTTNYYGRLARVNKGNLVLENITVTNSSSPTYGSISYRGNLIRLGSGTSITVNNCSIIDNKATFISDNGKANVNINNTIFAKNDLGTDLFAIIEINGKTIVNNTIFESNIANYGIISGYKSQKDTLTLNNVSFIKNTIYVGAPLYTEYDSTVSNSLFQDNKATRSLAKSGAIYTDGGSLTVTNSTFTGNTAADNDGTIIHHSGYFPGDLSVTNSILIPADNKAAIYNEAEDDTIKAVANYNYWGINTTPAKYVKSGTYEDYYDDEYDCTPIEVKYWVVMNTTATPTEDLSVYDTTTIETTYNKYTDGTNYYDLETPIPDITVKYTATSGTITPTITTSNGKTSTQYTLEEETTTITATDSYNTNTITLNAKLDQARVITLNDGNWTEYFDEEGSINTLLVKPGDELRFEGEFNDRVMFIDMPLNLTTAENNRALLKNSIFYIVADNVNVTELEINNENMEESPLYIEASNINIENNVLTLTNTEREMFTHTIKIEGQQENITIKSNTITTTGPEDPIDYAADYSVNILYTTSIYSQSGNVIIDSNTITTNKNDQETDSLGTIYGVFIQGSGEEDTADNVQITNNDILVEGQVYDYAIKMDWANNATITDNTVTVTSGYYSSGIHLFATSESTIKDNTVNNQATNMVYGIVVEGAKSPTTSETIVPKNVLITNNTVTADAKYVWAIETFAGDSNTISYNTITVKADNGIGIGLTDQNSQAYYNNITVTATMNEEITGSFDYINPETTGIKIVNNGIRDVRSNNVTHNNITVNGKNKAPAVNSTTNNNKITENYLISPKGQGDRAVLNTGIAVEIHNNIPVQAQEDITINLDEIPDAKYDDTITISGTLTVNDETLPNTPLNITINDQTQEITTNNEGQFTLNITANKTGENTVKITIEETDEYTPANTNTTFNVNKQDTKLTIDTIKDAKYNDTITITGTLKDANNKALADKNITIKVNDQTQTVKTDANGKYSLTITALTVGKNTVTVTFNEEENYNKANTNTTFNIAKQDTVLTVDAIKDAFMGDNIVVTGSLKANGVALSGENVLVNVNGKSQSVKTDANGKYSLTVTAQTVGKNNVTVSYAGNSNYNPANGSAAFNVAKRDAVLTVDAIKDAFMGDSIVVTGSLKVNGVALSGESVLVDVNGESQSVKTDANGKYSLTVSAQTVGKNNVTVTYAGNSNYNPANGSAAFNVAKRDAVLTVDAISDVKYTNNAVIKGTLKDGNNALAGVTLTVKVNDKTQTVKTNNNGEYTLTITPTTIGKNTVTVTYNGDNKYNKQEKTTTFNLLKQDTKITINPVNNAKFSDNTQITGTLTDNNNKALYNTNIIVKVNGKAYTTRTDASGKYTVTVVATNLNNNVVVSYAGNSYYNSASTTATFTAAKQTLKLTIDKVPQAAFSDNVIITGTLTDNNNKALYNTNLVVKVNGKSYTAKTDANGKYTVTVVATNLNNNVVVSYAGNGYYESVSATTTFAATKQSINIKVDNIKQVAFGDNTTITGTVTDKNGNKIYNTNIVVKVNGKAYTTRTDANGKYTVTVTATNLNNNVVVSYAGNSYYNSASTTATFTATKQAINIKLDTIKDTKFNGNATITGTVTDKNGNKIYNTNIAVKVNGKAFAVKTDANGKFTTTQMATRFGTNNVEVTYAGNNYYNSASATATFNAGKQDLVATVGTVKLSGKTGTVTGTLKDANGNKMFNTNIAVTVNGKVSTVKTDANGAYTLSTDAVVSGSNTVTVSYGGNSYYNSVKTTKTVKV